MIRRVHVAFLITTLHGDSVALLARLQNVVESLAKRNIVLVLRALDELLQLEAASVARLGLLLVGHWSGCWGGSSGRLTRTSRESSGHRVSESVSHC